VSTHRAEAVESSDPERAEFKAFVTASIAEMRAAKGDARSERMALCRYFKRGGKIGYSMEFLVDVLGISSDVLDGAGYGDEEALRVMDEIVANLDDEEIERATID
jgi:hypothetical protein